MCDAIDIFNPLNSVVDPMFEVETPPVPSYNSQMTDALRSQIALMPELLRAEQQFGPQFIDLMLANQQRYLTGANGQGGMLDLQRQARAGDIADVAALGPQAYQAVRGYNPAQAQLMDALNQQALQQVQLGGQMTPDQRRMIQNQVLGQRGAAGWGYDPGDLAEVARQASGYSDQLQQARMLQGGAMAGVNQNIYGDPFMQILGRPSTALGTSVQGTQNLGPSLFQPESQMAWDTWNVGYTGQLGANMAKVNNRAAFWGDTVQAAGSIVGGAMACHIARELYGVHNHQWLRFRHWLYNFAPDYFRIWYEKNGQSVAAWLRRRSWLARKARPWIKRWMDSRIRSMRNKT